MTSNTKGRERADSVRNRARVLQTAHKAFTADGPSVSVSEIARRAGVGVGTVYRHFPTKDALLLAVLVDRFETGVAQVESLTSKLPPGEALWAFIEAFVAQCLTDQVLAEALSYDDQATEASRAIETRFMAEIQRLLTAARQAGELAVDIDADDVKTLIVGCHAMQQHQGRGAASTAVMNVVRSGLLTGVGNDRPPSRSAPSAGGKVRRRR